MRRYAAIASVGISEEEAAPGRARARWSEASVGFADSAQAFMFLSGLLVGIVGARQHARLGPGAVARRNGRRALELYGWHLGLLLPILAASRLLPDAWPAWSDWLGYLFEDGPRIWGRLEYSLDILDGDRARRLVGYFQRLLRALARSAAGEGTPQTVEALRRELGLGEEE